MQFLFVDMGMCVCLDRNSILSLIHQPFANDTHQKKKLIAVNDLANVTE